MGHRASSDPEVPPEIMQAIGEHVQQEVTTLVQAHFQAMQANLAHEAGTAAAHAYGAATGLTSNFRRCRHTFARFGAVSRRAYWSYTSGHTCASRSRCGLPPPPPAPPLPDPSAVRDRYDSLMEGARDQARRKAADQAKIAEDKLQEHLAQGGFYTALAEFLVDLPLFPYACIKGPTVRIKTQVKWTRDQAPWSGQPQNTPSSDT